MLNLDLGSFSENPLRRMFGEAPDPARIPKSGAQAKLQWSNSASGPWTDVSAVQELYTPLLTFNELHLNSFIDPSPGVGQKYFRWYITGKHPSSTNHDVVTDYIKLVKQ